MRQIYHICKYKYRIGRFVLSNQIFDFLDKIFELIKNLKILREIKANINEETNNFISGDKFKNICDFIVDGNTNIEMLQKLSIEEIKKVFYEIKDENLVALKELLNKYGDKIVVICHNGDDQSHLKMIKEERFTTKIFSTNVNFESTNVIGIPIGIENYKIGKNGLHNYLAKDLRTLEKIKKQKRKIDILVNFRLRTNKSHRTKVLNLCAQNTYCKLYGHLKMKKLRRKILKSKFVVSPRGNGLDCHRTWETLYLGANPIVMKGDYQSSLLEGLNIHCVDSFSEISNLNSSNIEYLHGLYMKEEISEKIYFPYWEALVESSIR